MRNDSRQARNDTISKSSRASTLTIGAGIPPNAKALGFRFPEEISVGGVLVLLGGAFLPQSKQVNAQNTDERVFDTVICRELRVVDAFGEVCAQLGSHEDGGLVVVWGKDKKSAASLVIYEDGGGLTIANNEGKTGGMFSADKFGGALVVFNNEGKIRGMLRATEDGGGLAIFNNEGKTVGTFGVSNTRDGILHTRDKYGNITGRVP